jgi:LysM repeat protein
MRTALLTAFFVATIAATTLAVDVSSGTIQKSDSPTPKTPSPTYAIAKGDTLWDLANKHYNNAWLWPKIWEANKSTIANPDRIYPDQVLVLPDKSVLSVTPAAPQTVVKNEAVEEALPEDETTAVTDESPVVPEKIVAKRTSEESREPEAVEDTNKEVLPAVEVAEETAEETPPAAEEQRVSEPAPAEPVESPVLEKNDGQRGVFYRNESMVVPEDWEADAFIIGDKDKKLMISGGDTVYINAGSDKVHPGMKCAIYRRTGKFRDPVTGDFIGYEMRRVGKIEITNDIGLKTATSKVTMSYDPIEVGDAVKIESK